MSIIIEIKGTSPEAPNWHKAREKSIFWLKKEKIEHKILWSGDNVDKVEFFNEEDALFYKLKFG